MLRVDPCFTVNAVKIGTAGAAAKEAIKTALQAAGMSADDAKVNAFVTQYNADLDELKRLFPGRVAFAA